jgi:hypothetical protein
MDSRMLNNFYKHTINKYHNIKVENKYGKFDSQREFTQFLWLQREVELGHIKDLQRQVKYVLIPAQYETIIKISKNGKEKTVQKLIERECSYIADFVYIDCETNEIIVEDLKSTVTEKDKVFLLKKKLMYYIYKIKIKVTK